MTSKEFDAIMDNLIRELNHLIRLQKEKQKIVEAMLMEHRRKEKELRDIIKLAKDVKRTRSKFLLKSLANKIAMFKKTIGGEEI